MKSVDEEMMGVSSVAGIGAAPRGVDPSSAEAKKFAEPGVHLKRKNKVVKATLKRFREWIEESKHDVRDAAGHLMKIKKVAIRHPGGKVTMEYPGKSGSSGGGD